MDAVPKPYDTLRIKRWVLGVRFGVFWLGWLVFQVDEGVILSGLGCWRLAFWGGPPSFSSHWEGDQGSLLFSHFLSLILPLPPGTLGSKVVPLSKTATGSNYSLASVKGTFP